jgi:hypothetical protein
METRGRGFGVSFAHYAASVLHNGLGQYEDALASAELATSYPEDLGFANLALAELVEAAVRSGRPERAAAALQRLTALTQPSGTAWGLGVAARSRALLSEGDIAERLYQEAIARLARRRPAPSLPARTCSTVSGCAPRTAAARHVSTCRLRTACCRRWRSARSANGPGGGWLPPAGRAARGRRGYPPSATR